MPLFASASYDPLSSPHLLQPTEDGVVLEEHALATQQVSSALVIVWPYPLQPPEVGIWGSYNCENSYL